MAGKTTAPAGDKPATDLTAILARLDELEKRNGELESLVAKAAPLSDFESLTSKVADLANSVGTRLDELAGTVASHGQIIADDTARLLDGEPAERYDARSELLKVHRQLEAVANHINIRLPS